MAAYSWILEIRPGYEAEYEKRHAVLPDDMIDLLNEAGFRNYSIFRYGLKIFGYFETDNLDRSVEIYAASPAAKSWADVVEPYLKLEIDPSTGFPYLLPQIWHFAGEPSK